VKSTTSSDPYKLSFEIIEADDIGIMNDVNERLYSRSQAKSMYVEEIDRRISRLRLKLAKARMESLKVTQVENQRRKSEKDVWRRIAFEEQAPYLQAFKQFGATNSLSKVNSSEFELGLQKLGTDFSRKTVLEIFGRYDYTRDGKIELKEFQKFAEEIKLVENPTEGGGPPTLSYDVDVLLELTNRLRRAAMAGISRIR
jgi:hypothetical protein